MNNLRLILFLFLNISFIGGFANARGSIIAATSCVDICQMRYTIPVLVLKDTNPVLKIGIKTTSEKRIENISLNLNGTTNLNDIAEITIYEESKEGIIALSKKLASTSKIKKTTIIPLEMSMEGKDSLCLWVSLRLKDCVNLSHRFNLNCHKIKIDGKFYSVPKKYTNGLRVGVALNGRNKEGIHTLRIPGLISLGNEQLIAVYDARYDSSRDLQGNIDICCQRSTDGGKTWGKIQKVLDMGTYGNLPEKYNGVSDAAILYDNYTGKVWVAATWMHGVLDKNTGKWIENLIEDSTVWNHQWASYGSQPGWGIRQSSQIILSNSIDQGKTWSKPINITSQVKRPQDWLQTVAPGNGIVLTNGTIVFPAQGRTETGMPFSNLIYSKDGGNTWKASKPAGINTTECTVVQRSDGSIMLNMRDNRNYRDYSEHNGRKICVTNDIGETWKEHPTSHHALIEPVCMASLYRHIYDHKKKAVLLFSNPDNKLTRTHITLKVSFDEGETWSSKKILLDELSGLGYSCITSVDENRIGILYESSQHNLVFQIVNLKELL